MNVLDSWISDDSWSGWPAPRNLIAGESTYSNVLTMVAGPPRDGGYLIPVEVNLVRDFANRFDRHAIIAELQGRQIGYLRRSAAAAVAPQIDSMRCRSFAVCGVLRGGSLQAPRLDVQVWLDRRLTPGPVILLQPDPATTPGWPSCDGDDRRPQRPGWQTATDHLSRADFMPRECEAEVLTLDDNGLPTGALERRAGRLVIVPDRHPDEIVNPRSTRTYRLGIYSLGVRGTRFHDHNVKLADLRPGRSVRLVREPQNDVDPNAIAIYTKPDRKKIGYVNRLNAKRLAPLLDAGADLAAISTRGDGPGRDVNAVMVLIARRDVLAHLMRRL